MRPRFEQRAVHKVASVLCRAKTWTLLVLACAYLASGADISADTTASANAFHSEIQPILQEFCFDCHADGANKGQVAFDAFPSDEALLDNHDLWLKALRNLRAGLM